MRIGVYPGTFDPITIGHMELITRALRVVDKLVVAIALDTGKEPIFNLEERAELVRRDVASLTAEDCNRVSVVTFSGLLVNFVREQNASIIVRGLRAVSDFEYEFQMTCMNAKIAPDIETIFLTASDSTQFISSRFVKQIARLGGDVSGFVSPNVHKRLKSLFAAQG